MISQNIFRKWMVGRIEFYIFELHLTMNLLPQMGQIIPLSPSPVIKASVFLNSPTPANLKLHFKQLSPIDMTRNSFFLTWSAIFLGGASN